MSLRRDIRTMLHSVLAHTPMRTAKPIRLTFRWGNESLSSAADSERKSLEEMQGIIAEYIQGMGPFPVRIVAKDQAYDEEISSLLRFAHRLNCPTELTLNGEELEATHLDSLIQSGVDWIWLPIGGVSAHVHEQATGVSIEQSTYVLHHLLELRKDTHTKVGVLIPWKGATPSEASAIRNWAEELGVDNVQIRHPDEGKKFHLEPIDKDAILSRVLHKPDRSRWNFLSYPWSREVVVHVPVAK